MFDCVLNARHDLPAILEGKTSRGEREQATADGQRSAPVQPLSAPLSTFLLGVFILWDAALALDLLDYSERGSRSNDTTSSMLFRSRCCNTTGLSARAGVGIGRSRGFVDTGYESRHSKPSMSYDICIYSASYIESLFDESYFIFKARHILICQLLCYSTFWRSTFGNECRIGEVALIFLALASYT